MTLHRQVYIKVNAEVDEGCAALVLALNQINGLVTLDSCQEMPPTNEAWVFFSFGQTWHELAGLLQAMSSGLERLCIGCAFSFRMEWLGSNDRPRAQLTCFPEHVAALAKGLEQLTATLNGHMTALKELHKMENLTVGRIVQYVLSEQDVEDISRRRVERAGHAPNWPAGAQAHVGNSVEAGEVVPAIVVWPHQNEDSTFNGQAFLDGNDTLWITSVKYDPAARQRTWHWPQRVG